MALPPPFPPVYFIVGSELRRQHLLAHLQRFHRGRIAARFIDGCSFASPPIAACAKEAQAAAARAVGWQGMKRPAATVLACFLSHVKACRRFVRDAEALPPSLRPGCAIIAEDDARFHADWPHVVEALRPVLRRREVDVISLGYFLEWQPPPDGGRALVPGFHLHPNVQIGYPWGTVAYLSGLDHARAIVHQFGHCLDTPRAVCELPIPSMPADLGLYHGFRRAAVGPPLAVEQPALWSLVENMEQTEDGTNERFDWITYPAYGVLCEEQEDTAPITLMPPRHRVERARFGHGDAWLDVTDRLPAGDAPFRVGTSWAGSDPAPCCAKELRLELTDGTRRTARELERVTLGLGGLERLDAILYINLEHRTDRRRQVAAQFARIGIHGAQRVAGIRQDNGALGCALAHLSVLRQAARKRWRAFLICEDDVFFLADRPALDRLVDAFLDDERASILCLAYNAVETKPYRAELLRTTDTQTASCYVVKHAALEPMSALFEEATHHLAAGGPPQQWAIDQVWKRMQDEYVFVIPEARAAKQRPSYSDIEKTWVSYGV